MKIQKFVAETFCPDLCRQLAEYKHTLELQARKIKDLEEDNQILFGRLKRAQVRKAGK
jgi:hypothetical protein